MRSNAGRRGEIPELLKIIRAEVDRSRAESERFLAGEITTQIGAASTSGGDLGQPSDNDPNPIAFDADPGISALLSRDDHVHPWAIASGSGDQLLGMNDAGDAFEWKSATYDEATGLLTLPVTGGAAGLTLGAAARAYEVSSGVLGLSPINIGGSGSTTAGATVGRTNTDAAVYGLNLSTTLIQTATAAIESTTALFSSSYKIGLGFTNNNDGAAGTLELDNLRASVASGGDSGTIGYQRALANYWGHSDDDLYASPLTTDSDGMLSYPKCKRGVLTTLRHLHISDVEGIAVPSTWASGTPYVAGNKVKPTVANGYWYICQTGGTSGGGEPAWNTVAEGSTNDNGVIWRTLIIPAVTTQHGISIDALSFAGTNRAIYFAGSGAANGLTWAGGANLYETSAQVLKSDYHLRVAAALGVGTSTPTTTGRIQCSEDLYAVGGHFSGPMDAGSGNLIGNVNRLYLDGSAATVSIGVNGIPEINSAAAFTITFWATFDDVTKATDGLFSKSVGSTNRVLIRAVADDFRVYINNGASNTYGHFTLSGVAANNELHFFAIKYAGAAGTDALRLIISVDGAEQTLAFVAAIPPTTGDLSTATAILSDTGTSSHQGYLSDFRVYSAALSAANLALVEAGDYAVAGMVHRWKMNDGTGATTCADTGSNPQAGTISGATWANLPMAGLGVDVPQGAFDLGANLGQRYGLKAGIARFFLSAAGIWKIIGSLIVGTDLTVNGNTQLGDASTDTITATGRLLVRSVTDAGPMTATGGTQREMVFNTSDSKFYGCTVTHATAATWVAFN